MFAQNKEYGYTLDLSEVDLQVNRNLVFRAKRIYGIRIQNTM